MLDLNLWKMYFYDFRCYICENECPLVHLETFIPETKIVKKF